MFRVVTVHTDGERVADFVTYERGLFWGNNRYAVVFNLNAHYSEGV